MALILAIESDHRQAGQLVQIVRRRLGAELILAETFEAALPAIDNRVPDLILVPALLSPEDDAALKFVLRVISHGSHVQVLTTPMFARSGSHSPRGVLAGFLRARTTSAVDGCDPEEFAKHIASYLEAAAEKRTVAPPPVIGPGVPGYDAVTPAVKQAAVPPPTEWPEPEPEYIVPIDAPEEVSAPAASDPDPLDRLVSDLNRLFASARDDDHPGGAAPVLNPPAAEPDSRVQEPAKPVIEPENTRRQLARVEPQPDQNSTGNEWGLYDPKECGLEALLLKLKDGRAYR